MTLRGCVIAAIGCVLLMAPTPGSVGACGGDDMAGPADFASYCEQRVQLICVRRFLRKETTEAERDNCRLDGVEACRRRSFPSDCQPTEREAQTCLNALASFDTLGTKEDDLAECTTKALCEPSASAAKLEPFDAQAGGGP